MDEPRRRPLSTQSESRSQPFPKQNDRSGPGVPDPRSRCECAVDSYLWSCPCTARNHHYIIDGPIQNDCPGEELTPPEAFLSAVASCGVEQMHVIARAENILLNHVDLDIHGVVDRGNQARADV